MVCDNDLDCDINVFFYVSIIVIKIVFNCDFLQY